jgi:hypothetical protein
MIFPTIHLNGTDGTVLRDAYTHAYEAVRAATTALADVPVNGRDYYPQGSHAGAAAYNEHSERVRHLTRIAEELHEIVSNIDEQMDARVRPSAARNP